MTARAGVKRIRQRGARLRGGAFPRGTPRGGSAAIPSNCSAARTSRGSALRYSPTGRSGSGAASRARERSDVNFSRRCRWRAPTRAPRAREPRGPTPSALSSAADATATMPRIVSTAGARRAFPRESRVRVASSFADGGGGPRRGRRATRAAGRRTTPRKSRKDPNRHRSFFSLFPGEPPEPIPARPGLFASSAVVHGSRTGS